jgi:hypothetical protein
MEERLDFKVHDKWQEAIYQCKKMLKSFKDYLETNESNQSDLLQNFRYDFNAFVNASRSVSNVLQNVYKGIPNWQNWYNDKITTLKNDKFWVRIKELRDINIHEGNHYPMIRAVYNFNDKIHRTVIFSGVPIVKSDVFVRRFQSITMTKIVDHSMSEIREIDNEPGMTIDEIIEKHQKEIIQDFVDEENRLWGKIEEEGLKISIIEKKLYLNDDFILNYEEFKNLCFLNLKLLEKICVESYELFFENQK